MQNNSCSIGSTVMFELSKSFSQLSLQIYRDKIHISLLHTSKWFKNSKKSEKQLKIFSPFFVMQNQTHDGMKFIKIVIYHFFWIRQFFRILGLFHLFMITSFPRKTTEAH